MDQEEERLKQQIDVRQAALKEKVRMLKERVEDVKRMGDVRSQVRQRPTLIFTGSLLAGFLTKKLLGGKNRHSSRYSHRSRPASRSTAEGGHPWASSASAILSAILIRAGTTIITELIRNPRPRSRR